MPKWSDMIAKLIPWLDTDHDEARRLRDKSAAVRREQEALAPFIEAQTDYLVKKGEVNGFTSQLQAGFQKKIAGE